MSEVEFKFRFAPNEKFYQTRNYRYPITLDAPVFTLNHTMAFQDVLGSSYDYQKTELGIQKRFWFSAFGYVDILAKAGKVWTKAPYPLLILPNANLSYLVQPESYTNMGKIKVKLFNDTPLHRDNFIKNVKEHRYDIELGGGRGLFRVHLVSGTCGAKGSFLVEIFRVTEFGGNGIAQIARLQNENKPKIMEFYRSGNKEELAILRDTLIGKTELEAEKRKDEVKLNPELREAYKNEGGVPFLDNQYTVYGEVVEGMDVVDAIQSSKTNKQDRPTENIVINSVEIL